MLFQGIMLDRDDFGTDLRALVALRIAAAASTPCVDRESALELLDAAAGAILGDLRALAGDAAGAGAGRGREGADR